MMEPERHQRLQQDRRASKRFAIEREVRYTQVNAHGTRTGTGRTVNLSSGGVLFTTEHPLIVGNLVVLEVSWPVQLLGKQPLKLVAEGRVVWGDQNKAAIAIERYEFRTQGARPF